jgi:hypothetical protein
MECYKLQLQFHMDKDSTIPSIPAYIAQCNYDTHVLELPRFDEDGKKQPKVFGPRIPAIFS